MYSLSLSTTTLAISGAVLTGCAALYCWGRYEEWQQTRQTGKSKEPPKPTREMLIAQDKCVSNFGQIPVKSDTTIPETAWPTKLHPAKAHTLKSIVNANAKLVRDICFASKLTEDEYMKYLVPVMFNLARYVHVCPASEYEHHQGYGGLFTHSLEVAYYAANKAAGTIFDRNSTPQDKHNNRRRWALTCILAGLLHDCGKPYTDMNLTATDGRVWHKEVPILTWLRNENIDEYFVAFRVGREHNEHQAKSLALYREIIPPATFEFLGRTPTGQSMIKDLESALLLGQKGGLIGEILQESDGLSCQLDMLRQRQVHPIYKNVGHPQGDIILKAIRALINSGSWRVNEDETCQVFNTRQGCFIQWTAECGDQISAQANSMGYKGIPTDSEAIARILVDAQAAMSFTPEGGHKPSLYKEIHPIFLQVGQLACIKLRDEKFIFDSVPPSVIECLEEGVPPDEELKIAWRKKWGVDPAPIRSADDARYAFDEDFIASEAETAAGEAEPVVTEAEESYFREGGGIPAEVFEQNMEMEEKAAVDAKYGKETRYSEPYSQMQSENQPVENTAGFGAKPREPQAGDGQRNRDDYTKFVIDPNKPLSMQLRPMPIDNPNSRGRGRGADRRDDRRNGQGQKEDGQQPRMDKRDLMPQNMHQRKITKPLETARAFGAAELLDNPATLAAAAEPDPENTPRDPNSLSVASTGPGAVKPVSGSALDSLMPAGVKPKAAEQPRKPLLSGLFPAGARKSPQKNLQNAGADKNGGQTSQEKPVQQKTKPIETPAADSRTEEAPVFLKEPTRPPEPIDPLLASSMGIPSELDEMFPEINMEEYLGDNDDAPNCLTKRSAAGSACNEPPVREPTDDAAANKVAGEENTGGHGAKDEGDGSASSDADTAAAAKNNRAKTNSRTPRKKNENDQLDLGLDFADGDLDGVQESARKESTVPGLPTEFLPADYKGPPRPTQPAIAAIIAEQKLMRQIADTKGEWIPGGIQYDAKRGARWIDAVELEAHLAKQGVDVYAVALASGWHSKPRVVEDAKARRLYIEE